MKKMIIFALLLVLTQLCFFSCSTAGNGEQQESVTKAITDEISESKDEYTASEESQTNAAEYTIPSEDTTEQTTAKDTPQKPPETTKAPQDTEKPEPPETSSQTGGGESPSETGEIEYAKPFTVYVTSNSLNVRTGPSTSFEKIDSLYNHEAVTVIGKNADWYIILADGVRGYCYAGYTTKEAPEYNYSSPYLIKINRKQNIVTVYEKDASGEFTVPTRAMICSTGLNNNTPCGIFNVTYRYEWLPLFGGVYGQYATRIVGDIVFHSVPYYSQNKDDIEYEEFNKLGEQASLGCVRMLVKDVKWIYDNVPEGTTIVIYDSADPEPLEKPAAPKIDVTSPNRGWDPTDPDPANPVYIA